MKTWVLTATLLLFFLPADAATIKEVKEYGRTYLSDLPNFVCTYTESTYAWKGSGWLSSAFSTSVHDPSWKLKRWHTGELRYNRDDTRWNRRVLTFKGRPTKKKLHKVSQFLGNFGSGVTFDDSWKWTKRSYTREAASDGTELDTFEVRSNAGITVYKKLGKNRNLKKPRLVPAWGEVWAEKETGRIRKVTLKNSPESHMTYEYAYFDIDGKSYLLPDKISIGGEGYLLTVNHYNYRRFQSKTTILTATSRINFGGKELGSETKFPPQTQEEPEPFAEETEAKEAVVPAPIKPKPPMLTRAERVRKSRKAKETEGRDFMSDYVKPALNIQSKKEPDWIQAFTPAAQDAIRKNKWFKQMEPGAVDSTRRGNDYFGERGLPPYLSYRSLATKPKPAPKKKVVRISTFPYGAFLNLFLIVGVIGAGMYFVRIR